MYKTTELRVEIQLFHILNFILWRSGSARLDLHAVGSFHQDCYTRAETFAVSKGQHMCRSLEFQKKPRTTNYQNKSCFMDKTLSKEEKLIWFNNKYKFAVIAWSTSERTLINGSMGLSLRRWITNNNTMLPRCGITSTI